MCDNYQGQIREKIEGEPRPREAVAGLRPDVYKRQEEKCVKADYYPFKSYKVSKLHQATAKRAISKADIMRIIEYRCDDFYKQFAVDLFAFGYFMGGINFVDIAYLKMDNIVDGRLIYTRRKMCIRDSLIPNS